MNETTGHAVTERLITPSSITAWLDCDHYLTLKHQVEDGLLEVSNGALGSFARLLMAKGLEHETACLEHYEAQGLSVLRIPERNYRETFAAWVTRVGDPFGEGYDVIYQMPFVHDGIRGIADFLLRVVDEDGAVTYEPVDAKLARQQAKPGHVLQLCFYADAIEAATGRRPERMHLWLGSGSVETLKVDDFGAYWRRLRAQLAAVMAAPAGSGITFPEKCDHCVFCEFADHCDAEWRSADSLIFVAGLRSSERSTFEDSAVVTMAELAERSEPVAGVRPERLERVRKQAQLQVEARAGGAASPPYVVIEAGEDLVWGHGFELLPAPDEGDVFLDFEGHPFWRADRGLFFLFGLIECDGQGDWLYRAWWAHSVQEEGEAAQALLDHLVERRAAHPGMHVYHYNHTERSSLERLVAEHGVGELVFTELDATGAFVDLLVVARNALQVGAENYGLKTLEHLTDYERAAGIEQGAGAVVEYESYLADRTATRLERIAAYNEDDVRATRALRDWLVEHRPSELPWREAVLEPDEGIPELDEQVERLHAYGQGSVEHLLGDVLGYWRREWSAHIAPLLVRCRADVDDVIDDPVAIAGLVEVGLVARPGKNGRPKVPALRLRFPQQDLGVLKAQDKVVFVTPDGVVGYSSIDAIDPDTCEVDLLWGPKVAALGVTPTTIVHNDWFAPKPKPQAVSELAARVLDPSVGEPSGVAMALLRRDLPAFLPGHGPSEGRFTDDLDEMLGWAPHLDGSYVAIQGPPGTGKTYRGARLVRALIAAGKRVGITAMSHAAIENLLDAVVDAFEEAGEAHALHAVKRGEKPAHGGLPGVEYAPSNPAVVKGDYNLVAGTTWLFAGKDMREHPVDVLIIDEAGQLSLADSLAAMSSAHNLVLLGDPLQLAQVSLASHPGGGGRSVLEHVLGDAATIPAERGVFLAETRRMHPDVCSFISDEIYEGRLTTYPSCSVQSTERGTGLRWLPAQHSGRGTESVEEADIVHDQIAGLIGTAWTDQHGVTAPLTTADLLVVAPYNDQVDLVRARLDDDPLTRGVAVGTADKLQGREAAIVFFTMATSTAADMTHTSDFLFSRNRFNVAISRARCLAYLVCTEDLLNSRGRTIEEMRLLSTICAFVERADSVPGSEE